MIRLDADFGWLCGCGGKFEFTATAMLLPVCVTSAAVFPWAYESLEASLGLWIFQVAGVGLACVRWRRHKMARTALLGRLKECERRWKELLIHPLPQKRYSISGVTVFLIVAALASVLLTMRADLFFTGIVLTAFAEDRATKMGQSSNSFSFLLLWLILFFSPMELGWIHPGNPGRPMGMGIATISYGLPYRGGSTFSEFRDDSNRGCVPPPLPQRYMLYFRLP
jgi:hypothetical protein